MTIIIASDAAPLDAATSTSGGYSASYDAAGDMTCRAPSSATTCAGSSPTGQQLHYDNERRLSGWQSAPSNPATSITYAYDADGQRIAQQVTSGGTTTTTDYIAKGLEEQTSSGTSTTLIKYESVPGVITAEITGSGSSESVAYLATDGLGSVSEAVDGHGNVLGAQLYGPYGGVRYSSGTLPTARGYTGQYADAASGLDYYNARYYDATLGQFTSADSDAKGGLNRYAYVRDNPETLTDPTGHVYACPHGCGGGGGSTGTGSSGGGGNGGGAGPVCNQQCYHHPGNGGGGGNGTGGGNHKPCPGDCAPAAPGTQQTSSSPQNQQCDEACKIKKDQSLAGDTGWLFTYIGGGLAALGALLGALAGFLTTQAAAAIASIFGIGAGVQLGELAAQVTILAGMVGALVAEAGIITAMFAQQSGNTDAKSWSYDSLEGFRGKVTGVIAGFTGAFTTIFGLALKVSGAVPGGFAGTWGAQIGSAVGVFANFAFAGIAWNAIDEMEDVGA